MTLSITVLSAKCRYVECRYAECRVYCDAECHYDESRYAEGGSATNVIHSLLKEVCLSTKVIRHF
jgi:hypothetical protein